MKEIKKGGSYLYIGWNTIFFSFLYLKFSSYVYVDGIKDYENYSTNTFIIEPFIADGYGIYLILRKSFRIAKQFEKAD